MPSIIPFIYVFLNDSLNKHIFIIGEIQCMAGKINHTKILITIRIIFYFIIIPFTILCLNFRVIHIKTNRVCTYHITVSTLFLIMRLLILTYREYIYNIILDNIKVKS